MAKYTVNFDGDKCKGCELCLEFCPKGIIIMSPHVNSKGYSPAAIERQDECIGCRSCALVCPDGAIEIFKVQTDEKNPANAAVSLPADDETAKHGNN